MKPLAANYSERPSFEHCVAFPRAGCSRERNEHAYARGEAARHREQAFYARMYVHIAAKRSTVRGLLRRERIFLPRFLRSPLPASGRRISTVGCESITESVQALCRTAEARWLKNRLI